MHIRHAASRRTLVFALAFALAGASAHGQATQAGIGIQIEKDVLGAKIASVGTGSPAERAGLHVGDVILSVDDTPLHNLAVDVMSASVRGPIGSSVRLVIMTANGSGRTIQVVRAVPIPTATSTTSPTQDPARSAPPAVQTQSQAQLPTQAPAQAPTAVGTSDDFAYVRWTEPREHAFTVDVPRGWQVVGGVNWSSEIDAQHYLRLRSPDGKVQIFVGDPDLLPRQVPTQWALRRTGVREGQQFKTPYGATAVLLRYATGKQYAEQHVRWRQLCQNPRTVWAGDRPDETASMTNAFAPKVREFGGIGSVTVGDVGFVCDDAQGFVYAATLLATNSDQQVQVWGILSVAGFVSTDALQSMKARIITEHMIATMKMDPAWEQSFEEKNRRVTGSYISMQNAQMEMQLAASRSASNDLARFNHPNQGVNVRPGSSRSSGVNTTLGTRDVCDAIGRCKSVSNDAESYFMDHSGNVRAGRAGGAPPDNSGVWSPTFSRP